MPLHIFETRYRQLIHDLGSLPADQQRFGVIAIRQGREIGTDHLNALYDIGCIADVRAIQPYADGRFDIVTMGTERFILRDLFDEKSYFTADVEFLPDALGANPDAMSNRVRQHFERYREIVQMEDGQDVLSPDPTSLSWEVAAGMLLDLDERQRILASEDTTSRLILERQLLHRELGLLAQIPSLPAFDPGQLPISSN